MRERGRCGGGRRIACPTLILFALLARGEIIDRIAVAVENQVIAESQVREELRIAAFLNREKPDFRGANRRKAAERLVDQLLIRREMEFTHYPGPDAAELEDAFAEVKGEHGTQAEFERRLAEYGIDAALLRQALARQAATLHFIELRFRPEVQAPEREDEAAAQKRVDERVERWLKEVKARTHIRYEEDAFE